MILFLKCSISFLMECFDIHTHLVALSPEHVIRSFAVGTDVIDACAIHISVGIHPWFLTADNVNQLLVALHQSLEDNRIVALGEAGLDKLRGESMELQISVFRQEVTLAERLGLPMIIHCVKAFNELMQLKKDLHPHQPWIVHGFRGKKNVAVDLLRQGCYLSFGARFQEEAVRSVPLERMFIETDESPESIWEICCRIAEVKGITPEELTEAINKNVREVFFKT